jgi:hypothetical protein
MIGDREQWREDPRSYAVELVDEGMVSADWMILALLNYLSHDEVRDALEANELGPEGAG